MIFFYLLSFFIFIGISIYTIIRYVEELKLEKFVEDMVKKKAEEDCQRFNKKDFQKPKEEEITDL